MTEIVLPSSLSADDVKCAEQVASELGLCTEVVGSVMILYTTCILMPHLKALGHGIRP